MTLAPEWIARLTASDRRAIRDLVPGVNGASQPPHVRRVLRRLERLGAAHYLAIPRTTPGWYLTHEGHAVAAEAGGADEG